MATRLPTTRYTPVFVQAKPGVVTRLDFQIPLLPTDRVQFTTNR